MTPDLIIHGAGIFGLSIAWEAARRGARVAVVDPHGVGAGSSGGVVGALAPHVPENWNPKKAFQLDSLLMADTFWRGVEEASGLPSGHARTGRLQPLADAAAVAMAEARGLEAATLWQGRAQWRVRPAQGGWEPPSPTGLLIVDTLSGRIHPRMALAALAEAVRVKGGTIGPEAQGAPVVWATGAAGLADLSRALGRNIGTGVKGQALVLRHDARDMPQLFVDGLHIIPHADGTVAIGSTTERDTQDLSTDAQLDALHAKAVAAVPVLAAAPVVERWAGLRPRPKSRAPMLGPWPDRPGHFIANGGFKIGFGMAPKVAQVMVDLVLDGRDAIPGGFRVSDN
ncbi:NAD(P)/FAD-dependent oxidoreductase [Falsirhodobacter sp. 20TX0035]|uniref:NAD(P)/FAD-dependent oxidoreductase n=1 Tax=Falsirhodobacter sp. 20TX0035 TaxID=3022019 RepID=UPI00232BCD3A|nr:FAD-binding oxidoreductase [Falsirhodobacter sp. 20TX0035]MDB6453993.1 FAD-binding oxidoreductase [Falsirhodobacter sp. 20TX0035]